MVIFYDAVPTEIRLIQRKGRTARQREGKVVILYSKGTSDEKNLKKSLSRLQQMHNHLRPKTNEKKKDAIQIAEEESQQQTIERFMDAVTQPKQDFQEFQAFPQLRLASTPHSSIITIYSDAGKKYKLTELFIQNSIPFSKETPTIPYNFLTPILANSVTLFLTILLPSKLQQARLRQDELYNELNLLSSNFEVVILGIDFLNYTELVAGGKENLIQPIRTISHEFSNIVLIPIDKISDLHMVLLPILINQRKEES